MARPDSLTLAVNHALRDNAIARARMGLLNPGRAGLDNKRPQAWCEYGWPEIIGPQDFLGLYRRGGVANGAVTKIIGACWRTNPWVIQGEPQDESREETPWERRIKVLLTPRFWAAVAEADRRRLVCRYSALVLRVRDSKDWDQPVDGRAKGLVEIRPVWATALTVAEYDNDERSETYGEPLVWQYTEAGQGGKGAVQRRIHRDRVFILGDWRDDAIGFLEPAYNAFVNLEKIEGGSGESFLKNAARQLSINFQAEDLDFTNLAGMYGVDAGKLQDKFNEVAVEMNRGNDTVLVTQGATTTPLVTAVADPEPSYRVNLQTAAAGVDIPTKILVGMQTGERASSEDQKYHNARCQSRRERELVHEIGDLVAHLMRIGVLDRQEQYTPMWDDLTDATQADRLANAKTMSEINSVALAIGEPVFDGNEIRTTAGFEPVDDIEPMGEGDGTEDEDDDETTPTDPAG